MRPWSDAFESSVVWTGRQLPLPFSRLPAGKCYKASASAPRQYQPGTMCSPVAWGSSIIFFLYLFIFFIFKLCVTHKEWARGHSLSEDKWNHLLRAPLTPLEKDGAEQSSSELPPQPRPNSYTSTQTSISDSLKTNLLHELPSPAAPWKRPCEQIASLKYEVKKNNTILSSSSDSGVCTFKVQSFVWAAVFCKAYFIIYLFFKFQFKVSLLQLPTGCGWTVHAVLTQIHLSCPSYKLIQSWIIKHNNDSFAASQRRPLAASGWSAFNRRAFSLLSQSDLIASRARQAGSVMLTSGCVTVFPSKFYLDLIKELTPRNARIRVKHCYKCIM